MLNSFLQYLRYEKSYSSHTVLSYKTDLNQFFHFHKIDTTSCSPDKIAASHIQQWILELMQKGYNARSIGRKLSALKSFWAYMQQKGLCHNNPTLKISLPKTKKSLPSFYQHKEISQLVNNPYVLVDNFDQVRNLLILEVFYMTGIRLAELLNIAEKDVDLEMGELRVIGKRNKERIIPLAKDLCEKIAAYSDLKKEKNLTATDYLFVKSDGKQMYPKLVYNIVNKMMSGVSKSSKHSPHMMRHSFATALLNEGADINAVKELLGHSSLAATQVYTHTSFEELHNIYKHAHPRAK